MQVKDALPRIRALVDDDAVARLAEPEVLGDLACREHDVSEHRRIVWRRVANAHDVLLRDDEDVSRRHRSEIFERERVLVLEDDLRRDLARDDFAKETAHGARA